MSTGLGECHVRTEAQGLSLWIDFVVGLELREAVCGEGLHGRQGLCVPTLIVFTKMRRFILFKGGAKFDALVVEGFDFFAYEVALGRHLCLLTSEVRGARQRVLLNRWVRV